MPALHHGDDGTDRSDDVETTPNRRRILASLGALAGAITLAGCPSAGSTDATTTDSTTTETTTPSRDGTPIETAGSTAGDSEPRTRLGVETLLEARTDLLAGDRLGLITNPSGVDSDLEATIDLLYEHDAFDLQKLFSPEHGIRGAAQAGERVGDGTDAKTGLPVVSLYGDTRRLQPSMVADLDALAFDVQSVGVRYYTYIYTLAYAMETAGQTDTRVVVLDRPNPVAPLATTGSRIDDAHSSFIGDYRLPIVHRMTVGELARYYNGEFDMGVDLDVVGMDGWHRGMWYDDTGLPWVPPSPNMPTPETATIYPGMVYVEAATLSEGRGTTKPFEYVGAPWIDGQAWAETLNGLDLGGVEFRPVTFEPAFDDHAGETVYGVQTHVLDRSVVRPVRVGLAMLATAFRDYPETEWLSWDDTYAIDYRANGPGLRNAIDGMDDDTDPLALADRVREGWTDDVRSFREVRERYSLYETPSNSG